MTKTQMLAKVGYFVLLLASYRLYIIFGVLSGVTINGVTINSAFCCTYPIILLMFSIIRVLVFGICGPILIAVRTLFNYSCKMLEFQ